MITLAGIELPEVLIQDEFARPSVDAKVDYSLGGTPIVWEQEVVAAPLDLVGGDDFAWIKRSTLQALYNIAKVPRSVYSLDYNGMLYRVRFRHEDQPVIEARPLVGRTTQDGEDYYNHLIIRLLEL